MRERHAEFTLWAATSVFLVVGAMGMHHPTANAVVTSVALTHAGAPVLPTSDSLLAALEETAGGDLFRPEREPFDQTKAPAPMVAAFRPPPPPRARLMLRGMVGGPSWDIIIEGIPGHDGATVLRVGQKVNGFVVRAVRRDTVVVVGPDTTWKLTLQRQ